MAKPRRKSDWQTAARSLGLDDGGTVPQIRERVGTNFSYNAAEDKTRRQAPKTRVRHEGLELTPKKRRKLQATAQDQARNHSLMAWMIRTHLDYVSAFNASIKTGNDKIDEILQRIIHWHGAPKNFDVAERLGRNEMFRLFEMEKVTVGDAGLIKLAGLKLQGIESDLITNGNYDGDENVNSFGLVVDASTGRRDKFCICNRGAAGNKYEFDHLEAAEKVIFDGYWTRLTSQYRGVSPLSTAINSIQDIAEGFEFNQIKAKMHALFGLAVMRAPGGESGWGGAGGATSETAAAADTAADTELDLNPRAVNLLDLNQGDDVKVIESNTPSGAFVEGSYLFMQVAMLALDMPATMLDSRRSTFSASIADLNRYEKANEWKRTKNRYARQDYSNWLISEIYNDAASPWGLRAIADSESVTLRDLQEAIEWIPAGSPWLDKLKQIMGDKQAIEIGEDNRIDATRRRGGDYFKNIDKEAAAMEYAKSKGVPIVFGSSGQKTMQEMIADGISAAKEAEADDTRSE